MYETLQHETKRKQNKKVNIKKCIEEKLCKQKKLKMNYKLLLFWEKIFYIQEWKINTIIKNKLLENKNKGIFQESMKRQR